MYGEVIKNENQTSQVLNERVREMAERYKKLLELYKEKEENQDIKVVIRAISGGENPRPIGKEINVYDHGGLIRDPKTRARVVDEYGKTYEVGNLVVETLLKYPKKTLLPGIYGTEEFPVVAIEVGSNKATIYVCNSKGYGYARVEMKEGNCVHLLHTVRREIGREGNVLRVDSNAEIEMCVEKMNEQEKEKVRKIFSKLREFFQTMYEDFTSGRIIMH